MSLVPDQTGKASRTVRIGVGKGAFTVQVRPAPEESPQPRTTVTWLAGQSQVVFEGRPELIGVSTESATELSFEEIITKLLQSTNTTET